MQDETEPVPNSSEAEVCEAAIREALAINQVRHALPKFFNPLFRNQGRVNRAIVHAVTQVLGFARRIARFSSLLDTRTTSLENIVPQLRDTFDAALTHVRAIDIRITESERISNRQREQLQQFENELLRLRKVLELEHRIDALSTSNRDLQEALDDVNTRTIRIEGAQEAIAARPEFVQMRSQLADIDQRLEISLADVATVRAQLSVLHQTGESADRDLLKAFEWISGLKARLDLQSSRGVGVTDSARRSTSNGDQAFEEFYRDFENRFRGPK
ncbi:MAG: hypothetical protein ACREIA_15625, partial [Opitutaceae bacterium]